MVSVHRCRQLSPRADLQQFRFCPQQRNASGEYASLDLVYDDHLHLAVVVVNGAVRLELRNNRRKAFELVVFLNEVRSSAMVEIASFILLMGLLFGSAGLWSRVLSKQRRQQPHILSARDTQIAPLGFSDVIAAIVIFAISQVAAGSFISFFIGIREPDLTNPQHMTWFSIIAGTSQLIAAGVTIFFLWQRHADSHAAGIYRETFTKDLKLGFAGFLLFVPPMLLLQAILTNFWEYEHPTLNLISPDSPLISVVSAWWVATIVAPVHEEILFRVVLLGWLLRCFANPTDILGAIAGGVRNQKATSTPVNLEITANHQPANEDGIDPWRAPSTSVVPPTNYSHRKTWAPVVIVALLFALVHIGQGPAPIPIFFLGLGLCLMYRQTGSVVPCIVTHFLLNTFSMTVFTIQQLYFPDAQVEEAVTAPVGIVEFLLRLLA